MVFRTDHPAFRQQSTANRIPHRTTPLSLLIGITSTALSEGKKGSVWQVAVFISKVLEIQRLTAFAESFFDEDVELRAWPRYESADSSATPIPHTARVDARAHCQSPRRTVEFEDMSKIEQMEAELRKLSQIELRQIRAWLDDIIEDELEFTPEFEQAIQQSERDMAEGSAARVREPEGS